MQQELVFVEEESYLVFSPGCCLSSFQHHTLCSSNTEIMTGNFFKGFTDLGLMLLVNKISQWLEKNVAESTGRKTLQENIPPHCLPVLASFLSCITVILKPDNPTFQRVQKKELKALYPFLLLLKRFSGHFFRPVPRYQQWTIMTAQLR